MNLIIYIQLLIFIIFLFFFINNKFYYNKHNNHNNHVEKKHNHNNIEKKHYKKIQKKLYNNIYNPLFPPNKEYAVHNKYINYQLIGFLYNTNSHIKYPLYGKLKYPGKSDRYEYYIIDESRNKIKIPITTKNYNELYSEDIVYSEFLDEPYKVEIYDYINL